MSKAKVFESGRFRFTVETEGGRTWSNLTLDEVRNLARREDLLLLDPLTLAPWPPTRAPSGST
jgi:hypothetical protein